jgi:hypothetical protein
MRVERQDQIRAKVETSIDKVLEKLEKVKSVSYDVWSVEAKEAVLSFVDSVDTNLINYKPLLLSTRLIFNHLYSLLSRPQLCSQAWTYSPYDEQQVQLTTEMRRKVNHIIESLSNHAGSHDEPSSVHIKISADMSAQDMMR